MRGRSRRLSLNYRTTQEILAWAVPLLGTEPVIGLDGEVDSLLGYRSPMHGPRPQRRLAAARAEEFNFLTERVRSWLSAGIEPHAIGVAARSASLVREARQALEADGIATVSLSGRGNPKAVRAGTMHAMKGLEFQAVAVIGVEQGLVPAPGAVTPEREDAAVHAQDLQRERCVLFVACTRARDHLYVSGTGEPSVFLPPGEEAAPPPPPPPPILPDADIPAFDLGRFFRLLLSRRRLDPGMDAESFLAWATAPGRRLRLAELDVSSRQVLSGGGDQVEGLVSAPAEDAALDLALSARARVAEVRTGTVAAPVIVTPPRPRSQSDVVQPRPLASGAEVSSGQLTIVDRAAVDGLAAALYLARAPWRAPVIVPVPSDGVVKLPPEVHEAGPLRVLLGVEDPWTVTNWPDWPGRDSFGCAAPGIPASADLEEDALSRFLGGQRDLPVRPRRADRLWRLLYLAGDLIAAGAPADLRERCSAVLGRQPGLALTGLLDSGLDSAACLVGLISTGLATARPVMMDDMRAAERLWHTVPAAAAVLCTRLLAGPAYLDEDPAAVVVEAALAQCGPTLDALLRGDDDPCVQVFSADPFKQADLFEGADLLEAKWPAAVVVPQPLLDADTRAVAARQLFDAWSTPELTGAAQDATSVVRSAERLVAATPYRRAAAQIAARRLALPAMSASLALVGRIAARGDEACRSFERTWRGCWTDLARRAPDLTGIDLVLAEAHIAAAERAWFAK